MPAWPVRYVRASTTRRPPTGSGSRPESTEKSAATSATLRAIGPGLSWLELIGTTWVVSTAPTVGLSPATPLSDAGQVIDPSVSVPTASGASPAASAAPEPDDDPPADRSSAHGLATRPPVADQPLDDLVERMLAHWLRLVLAMTTAPAPRSRATSGASRAGRPTRAVDPADPPQARRLDVVLDHDGQAVQRAERDAGAALGVAFARDGEGVVGDPGDRAQGHVGRGTVDRRDPLEQPGDERLAGQVAGGDGRRRLGGREGREVGAGGVRVAHRTNLRSRRRAGGYSLGEETAGAGAGGGVAAGAASVLAGAPGVLADEAAERLSFL